MKSTSSTESIAKQAIEWMVFLRSGEATHVDFEKFEKWRAADEGNNHACRQIEAALGKIETLSQLMPTKDIHQTLLAPSSRRKFIQHSLCVAGLAGFSGLLVNQQYPLAFTFSDAHTDTAQRKNIELDDGSTISMNARTAINISYSDLVRGITLKAGGIIANVVSDARPFIVDTDFGQIIALNSRWHVRQENQGIHLAVLDSVVKVKNNSGATQIVRANQGLWFNENNFIPQTISPSAETAWLQGRLEVNNSSLSSVINTLRSYTPAFIHLDSAVADLRVSGVFPLENVPYTLDSLAQTMPIAITRTTDYLIRIHPATV
ncbi:FecR family protein [Sodalis sp. RH16]|uniref:FecR family protein n=1 Tax=Sodalis sp. RH16 TaxID=3394331 RepID=UPI0039B5EFCD